MKIRQLAPFGLAAVIPAAALIMALASAAPAAATGKTFTVGDTTLVACWGYDPGTIDANVHYADGTGENFHPTPYTLDAGGCYSFPLNTAEHGPVVWAQVHDFDCHYGEDNTGREDNCQGPSTPTTTEEPTETPCPETSSPPSSSPPSTPPATNTPPATPPATTSPTPPVSTTPPGTPSPSSSASPPPNSSVSPSASATNSAVPAVSLGDLTPPTLAATGIESLAIAGPALGLALLGLGALLITRHYRKNRS